jgi:inhibitor of cysteine peptidase
MVDVSLTAADSGRVRSVNVGDVVVISLDESPTSGYRWDVEDLTPLLAPAGDDFIPARHTQLGGGGTRALRFEARAAGEGRITLHRWRSWEGEASIIESFDATIEIRG